MHTEHMITNAPSELPLNRLFDQFIHPGHHTFKTKWHNILLQIFGYEGSIANDETSINHCYVFNMDFYRVHQFERKRHLDPVKLYNPFKWIEFLLVAPLEMFSFSLRRPAILMGRKAQHLMKAIKKENKFYYFYFFLEKLLYASAYILTAISGVVDLGVNLITGTARRCLLAPARYIIRPGIEMSMKYPKSFASVVVVTASAALIFTVLVLTGGLPAAVVGSQFLAFTLAAKLATVALTATWVGSALTKGFNTIREFFNGIDEWRKAPSAFDVQLIESAMRNQQLGYNLNIIRMDITPDKTELDAHFQNAIPLFIWVNDTEQFIYGRSPKGETTLKKVRTFSRYRESLFEKYDTQGLKAIVKISPENVPHGIYGQIFDVAGHYKNQHGSTKKNVESSPKNKRLR